jgi:hypothetical protein
MAFFTIHADPHLDAAGRRLAYRHGPRMLNARGGYLSILERAGFRGIRATDVTKEYLRISSGWQRAYAHYADDLRAVLGDARVRELQSDSRLNVEGIRRGLLRRSLFVAVR